MEKGAQPIIVIRKNKGHGHGHHGGSWKVAFADFMTAMMAFFLLMWVLETTTPEEQAAIADFFNDPGNEFVIGPGGADSAIIDLNPAPQESDVADAQAESPPDSRSEPSENATFQQSEKEQLDALKLQLEAEINSADSVFQLLKEQILIDFTALGLRIQIVDKEQRPMFDMGSADLKPYSMDVLKALAPIIDKVSNKISVTGHTDSTPYGAAASYTNWELSADRANSARRALVQGAYPEAKVVTVQGMGSVAPYLVDKPADPTNRRIAIIVLKKAVADALTAGEAGLKSSDLMDSPITPLPNVDDEPKVMSESEVDAAIEEVTNGAPDGSQD